MSKLTVIGRAEKANFPEVGIFGVPARVDTGAKTSSVWASGLKIDKKGKLNFYLFSPNSPYYAERKIRTKTFQETVVANSMGTTERRYKVRLLMRIKGKKIRGSFTLANREQQVYPVLVGRNILRGKFVVNVKKGKVLKKAEKARTTKLRSSYNLKSRVKT